MALAYLFAPSTDTYGCPLAMTDGAARTLLDSGHDALVARALPHLTSRDPATFWTSGQWMTESTGGSDVGRSETVARQEDGAWKLYGRKWFTSAATSQIAVTLARPEGNPSGSHGLALFYLETRDASGRLRNIRVNRLKDKLGTRKLPTAELSLEGAPAELVLGTTDGVRNIAPMLNITRTWNALTSVATMRRGLALARDYAKKRVAFGATLTEKPLHVDTLAGLQAEMEGAFHLAFFAGELLGRLERDALDDEGKQLLRLLTPLAKLTTAKQAVAVSSEILESFGGAGYVEDTGLPALLRDAQVLSIWEGTTNVLSLDALRAIGKGEPLAILEATLGRETAAITDPALADLAKHALDTIRRANAMQRDAEHGDAEANARRFALTLGRSTELALLARHAQWPLDHERDARPRAAALRLRANGVDALATIDADGSKLLTDDR
jgi:alkylation response protein AidB-like acyl-CoA dehydrogenase